MPRPAASRGSHLGSLWGTYPRGSGHHPVGEHKEVQADQLEDVFEEVDYLQGQHVLGTKQMEVVSQPPAFQLMDTWRSVQ